MGLFDPRDPQSFSAGFRAKRDIYVRELIVKAAGGRGQVAILDLGGTYDYWRRLGVDFLRANNATVTLVNHEEAEFVKANPFGPDADLFATVVADACDLHQFRDNSFDFVHSNSLIEHLGTWDNMRACAREVRRLAPSYYVQTPYFWFPIEPHFAKAPCIHWFPRPLRALLLRTFPIAFSGKAPTLNRAFEIVDGAKLLNRRQFDSLFPDAAVTFEKWRGFRKSLLAGKA